MTPTNTKDAHPLGRDTGPSGWTSGTLDLQLRPVVGDRWAGRGAALVASGEGMGFVAVCLHELAHVLDRPRLYYDPPALVSVPEAAEHTTRQLADEMTATDMVSEHSPRWCRLALHLAARAGRLNCGPSLADVFGYGHLIPFAHPMFRTLEAEVENWHGMPLSNLDRIPIPEPFLSLWHESADFARDRTARQPAITNPEREP